ncbi:MAG: hypothetical protein H7842_05500, partial [Gammaproteobacteria bacterium SHHR-1]
CGLEPSTVIDLEDDTPKVLRQGKGDVVRQCRRKPLPALKNLAFWGYRLSVPRKYPQKYPQIFG